LIISQRYRYLFIEIPLTGSWSIRNELLDHYDGFEILHKHATYPDFLRIATDEEKKYFVVAGCRNPLDEQVSSFFKLKSDHKGLYSDPKPSINSFAIDYADIDAFKAIQKPDASFESFFLSSKIWARPYSNMIDISSPNLDFVIRFERLNEDFSQLLTQLGVRQVRPVPVSNKTLQRTVKWESYYTQPMIPRAKRIYGPFMNKWGYEIPEEWGDYKESQIREAEYRLSVAMKKVYLTRIRYNNTVLARIFRWLNGKMKRFVYT
jgi:hypothetical protein